LALPFHRSPSSVLPRSLISSYTKERPMTLPSPWIGKYVIVPKLCQCGLKKNRLIAC
jgi:hypothetical protein